MYSVSLIFEDLLRNWKTKGQIYDWSNVCWNVYFELWKNEEKRHWNKILNKHLLKNKS